METLTPPTVLRKPTGAIQLSNWLSLQERRLLNALLYYAQANGGLEGREVEISLASLYQAIGWSNSHNRDQLRDALRRLISTVIEWNEFGEDRAARWTACSFLSSGSISRNRVSYMINPKAAQELLSPILYAKIMLLVQTRLKGRHALVLYEFFVDALDRRASVQRVEIARLLRLLNLAAETYGQFKYLKRDVLKPALDDINRLTDLRVDYEPIREGRRIEALKFSLERNSSFQLPLDLLTREALTAAQAEDADTQTLLCEYGVNPKVAGRLVERFDEDRILRNIDLLEEGLLKGDSIANRGAWLRKAIEEDWRTSRGAAPIPSGIDEIEPPKVDESQVRKTHEEAEWRFRKYRLQQARAAFKARTKSFQTRRQNQFRRDMKAAGNTIVLQTLDQSGWQSAIVEGNFFTEALIDELLNAPHERTLAAFLAWEAEEATTAA